MIYEYAIYGLETPGLNDLQAVPESVESHARTLLGELCQHQPHKPYWLASYSAGATIGFEMTR